MKNTVLKLSAFFFSAVLFISLFPATPSLAYTVSGRCGESLTRIGEANGIWLIREFGTMFEYESDAEEKNETDETEKDGEFMIHPGMRFNRSMMMKV